MVWDILHVYIGAESGRERVGESGCTVSMHSIIILQVLYDDGVTLTSRVGLIRDL